jgi:hypothetical protein
MSPQLTRLCRFWINYGIDQNMDVSSTTSWRIPMAFQLVPGGILLIGGFLLHESPLWLMRKGRNEEAYRVLEVLRRLPVDHEYVQEEVHMIQMKLHEESSIAEKFGNGRWAFFRGACAEFSRKGMRNRVWLVWWSFVLNNYSGAAGESFVPLDHASLVQ